MKADNKILIITGGAVDLAFIKELINKETFDLIIAADRGLMAADRLGLSLDYIVGDFDSVPEEVLAKYQQQSTPIQTFPTEKDKTDTQIALELALMHNPGEITILGALGSRMDHTLANIHLLLLPLQLNKSACLMDPNNKIYLKNKSFQLQKRLQFGKYVSLLPFSERVTGLTLFGFKYPLDHIILGAGTSLGISNEIEDEVAKVEFREGILLVMETKDE